MFLSDWYDGQMHGHGYHLFGDKSFYDGYTLISILNITKCRYPLCFFIRGFFNGHKNGDGYFLWSNGTYYSGYRQTSL
jgi:hypothetical protein